MALIKFNTNQTCVDFFNSIKNQPDILQALKSGQKYEQNTIRMNNRALQLNDDDRAEVESPDNCC